MNFANVVSRLAESDGEFHDLPTQFAVGLLGDLDCLARPNKFSPKIVVALLKWSNQTSQPLVLRNQRLDVVDHLCLVHFRHSSSVSSLPLGLAVLDQQCHDP